MSKKTKVQRRTFLQLLAGSALSSGAGFYSAQVTAADNHGRHIARIGDSAMALEMDEQMRCRIAVKRGVRNLVLSDFSVSEYLRLSGGKTITQFTLVSQAVEKISGAHGVGVRHRFVGVSVEGIEKTVLFNFYDSYPGFAVMQVSYRNAGNKALTIDAWVNAEHTLKSRGKVDFWSFSGASHEDRRDWIQPVKENFSQRNFMGMNASDYGGGTPVVDVWHRDGGLAVGHIEMTPKLVAMPLIAKQNGAKISIEFEPASLLKPGEAPGAFDALYEHASTLKPGEVLNTFDTFLSVHTGDYFTTLDTYRRLMAVRGLKAPDAPDESYEPVWCAWGYERDFTLELMVGTLKKAKDLGLEWAVLDDGWQTSEGDWKIDPKKFPRGDADMKSLVHVIKQSGLKPRLWLAPLAVDPGTDLLHDHTDMLLLNKDGAVQNISWWNSFYLCPAYDKTIEHTKQLVRKILGEWGYAGLKIDGQHLNGVAPCYNPAHKHTRPEESVEKLQDFWKAVYETAMEVNPKAVVEICPCGTSFAFHNMPYMNQTPAADPLTSWQVRLKGKTLKALMGPSAPYAGDHVELSDHANDFASTVGIGAVVSTKFTWPMDPKPKNSFLLTPEKEIVWREWISLYKEKMLSKGIYRGELYDIGFDKPEAHVIEKEGRLYYAFYAPHWSGTIELRGLNDGMRYRLQDYVNRKDLGLLDLGKRRINVVFDQFLLIEAIPSLS